MLDRGSSRNLAVTRKDMDPPCPVPRSSKLKVLDIGPGRYRQYFPGDPLVIRVDINRGEEPDTCARMERLPFTDNTFDLVYCSHVLEHVFYPMDVALEILRVLKHGGEIALFVPNIRWAELNLREGVVDDDVIGLIFGKRRNRWDVHFQFWIPETWEEFILNLPLKRPTMTRYWRNTIMTWGIKA